MKCISADEFVKIWPTLGQDEVVVDVREEEEYADGHIPGSLNLPLSSIGKNLNTLKDFNKIYLICESGGRSSYAHEVLKTADIETIDIEGGLSVFRNSGITLEVTD